jgi:ribosomal protein L24E
MNRIHNKHGPARAICLHLTRHARDGIGSDNSARDGTILIVCSMKAEMLWQRSGRMPRDATIIAEFSRNIRSKWTKNHNLIFGRIRRKIRFRWRNMLPENRPSGPVQGEVCPDVIENHKLYKSDNECYITCDLMKLIKN